jgi:hypothetical protein
MDNTPIIWEKKTICSNEKVNEHEHEHREMQKKVDQLKKEQNHAHTYT